jgi:hypothetical protein
VVDVVTTANRKTNNSPNSEIYFDAIWEYRDILSEESQNAMMDYGFRYLGLEPERISESNDGIGLDRIRSARVAKELEDILHNPEASNSQRCYLVGMLGCEQVGYSESEIIEIVHENNRWANYSPRKTEYHVRKLLSKLGK